MRFRGLYCGLASLVSGAIVASLYAVPVGATGQILISNTWVQKITETSAVVSWTTSVPTVSEVDFGPSTQYGSVVSDPQAMTQHRVTLRSSLLLPGVTYHFITKNNDQNGTVAVSDDGFFTTRGTQLNIQVVDMGISQSRTQSSAGMTAKIRPMPAGGLYFRICRPEIPSWRFNTME